jgi:uncharacterized lipoprotein YajG
MNIRTAGAAALLLASAILGGCATSRSELKIGAPDASPTAAVTKQRAVVIRSVRDERQFAEKPSDPSVPSLGFGGSAAATEQVKARAIGRKRNGFGQALGDVLLQDGQTVTGVVRDNLSSAFRQAGYRVAPDLASAGPSPLLVDVRVRKFWAWFTPGMMTITLASQIDTDLQISGGGAPTTVSVSAQDNRMAATEDAWVEIVQKALVAYRAEAAKKVSAAPF